jgi:hypothetical protein
MHDTEFFHEHALSEAERAEIARHIWAQESVFCCNGRRKACPAASW